MVHGDVYNAPLTLFNKQGCKPTGKQEVSSQICINQVPEPFWGNLEKRLWLKHKPCIHCAHANACVVHQHIESAPCLTNPRDGFVHRLHGTNIQRQSVRIISILLQPLNNILQFGFTIDDAEKHILTIVAFSMYIMC